MRSASARTCAAAGRGRAPSAKAAITSPDSRAAVANLCSGVILSSSALPRRPPLLTTSPDHIHS